MALMPLLHWETARPKSAVRAVVLALVLALGMASSARTEVLLPKPLRPPPVATMPAPPMPGCRIVPAPAREPSDDDIERWNQSIGAVTPAQEARMADRMATWYGGTRARMFKERDGGWRSWGQIVLAHEIARRSHRPVAEIWRLRESKLLGWERIAKRHGLSLGAVRRSAERRVDALNRAANAR